jgi:RHH-type proline utilization regulon transcriptional repressor/proline dehydrogenase/delta 1-pyrroline-5-carboxylate dehydrogenase
VERRGERIFELVDRHPESLFSKAGFYQRMMALSMRDEHFKVQMFRFVDVLASLRRGGEIVRHLDEYFAGMRNGFAPLVQTGVRLAKVAPWVSGQVLRWNVSGMARQFIAGKNPDDVMKTLRKRRNQRIGFTVDLLGEAVVSEKEATEYAARCLELLDHLAEQTQGWTDPLGDGAELFPVVNLSVKISALYSQMNPADPADASSAPSSTSTWKVMRTKIPRSNFSRRSLRRLSFSIGRTLALSFRPTCATRPMICGT